MRSTTQERDIVDLCFPRLYPLRLFAPGRFIFLDTPPLFLDLTLVDLAATPFDHQYPLFSLAFWSRSLCPKSLIPIP